MSSEDSDEIRTMHASNHTEIMIGNETSEIIEGLFESFLQKYQEKLEESMRRSEFLFECANLLYYKLQKVILSRGRSYIHSPKWPKNKKALINPKNKDDKCFHYTVAVALNHEQVKSNLERISKIKPFIDQCNWKEINFHQIKKIGKNLN